MAAPSVAEARSDGLAGRDAGNAVRRNTQSPFYGTVSIAGWRLWLRETAILLRKQKFLHFLILPGVIWYLVFRYVPIYGITMAFKEFSTRLGILGSPWIGFGNFVAFFTSPYFFRVVRNDFLLSLYSLICAFPVPFVLALILNELRNETYKRFVQTVSYLPHFLSTSAVVGMLVMFLSPQTGFINLLLKNILHVQPVYFLGRPEWFRTVYIASGVWQGAGWGAIIYLAAISTIDPQIYESAMIDGATRLQRIVRITVPLLKPTIAMLLILNIGGMMSHGAEKILQMYSPATYETADVISTYVYRRGLIEQDYDYAAAVGLFSSVANLLLLLVGNGFSRKYLDQSLW